VRLGVDHGGDERGIEALVVGLLADDVLVAQREGDLAHGVVELRPREDDRHRTSSAARRAAPEPPAQHGAPARGGRRAGARAAAGGCLGLGAHVSRGGVQLLKDGGQRKLQLLDGPLFATTYVARALSPAGESWRADRSSTAWWPRAAARSARTSSSATTAMVAS
jgi:hypothetical protein